MMKKLFVICSWALLLGGCKSESGASDPDGDKPVPPPSAELLQKIEDLNAGLVSLKTLAGAVSPRRRTACALRSATGPK